MFYKNTINTLLLFLQKKNNNNNNSIVFFLYTVKIMKYNLEVYFYLLYEMQENQLYSQNEKIYLL